LVVDLVVQVEQWPEVVEGSASVAQLQLQPLQRSVLEEAWLVVVVQVASQP
jgi:hypothetical protein